MGYRLEELTWPQAEKALNETKTVVIPTGSIEQHGPHCPLGTDYFAARAIAERVVDLSPVVVAPTIPIGFADYHSDFAGTLSISEETLTRVYREICSYLVKYGVTHIVFSNSHGGNIGPITQTMTWLRDRGVLAAAVVWYEVAGRLNPKWTLIGHGDYTETSIVLAVNEKLVDFSKVSSPVRKNLSEKLILNDIRDCRFKGVPVHVGVRIKDYTDTGDLIEYGWFPEADHTIPPTAASADMGREIIDAVAKFIAEFIEEFRKVKLPLNHKERGDD